MVIMTCCDRHYTTVAESVDHKCMPLTQAIELVVADTRESTDPNLTIREAIDMVRETGEDCAYSTEGELLDAYTTVLNATDSEIERDAGLVIASL